MSSSSSSGRVSNIYENPLISPPKDKEKSQRDWVKIAAIVAAVIGGLIAALAVLCMMSFLPTDLLGGPLGVGITLIVGVAILAPAALIIYDRWKNPPKKALGQRAVI